MKWNTIGFICKSITIKIDMFAVYKYIYDTSGKCIKLDRENESARKCDKNGDAFDASLRALNLYQDEQNIMKVKRQMKLVYIYYFKISSRPYRSDY